MSESRRKKEYRDRAKVHIGKVAVRTRLADLDPDLDADELRSCVLFGTSEGARCTEHEPSTARGSIRWHKTTGAVRENLSGKHWQRHDDRNWPTVVNPKGSLGITVSSGNENTGIEGTEDPKSRNPKGPATRRAVERNVVQRQFADVVPSFPRLVDEKERLASAAPDETWVLLYREDEDEGTTYMELSRPILTSPVGDSEACYITGWSERIVLEPNPGQPSGQKTSEPEEPEPPIEVPVQRRSAAI